MEKYSNRSVLATHVIGKRVLGNDNGHLGKIVEIVLDKFTGQVNYAVLSSGGFMGMGEAYHALPWSMLSYDASEDAFIVNVGVEYLKSVSGFDKNSWPDFADSVWNKAVIPAEKLLGSVGKTIKLTTKRVVNKTSKAVKKDVKPLLKKAAKTPVKKTINKTVKKAVKDPFNKLIKSVTKKSTAPKKDAAKKTVAKSAKKAASK